MPRFDSGEGSKILSGSGIKNNLINIEVMEKIKNQVNAIVVYKGATFQELDQEYNDLGARIEEGIERMKAAGPSLRGCGISGSRRSAIPFHPRNDWRCFGGQS